jgi:hypothetical protein
MNRKLRVRAPVAPAPAKPSGMFCVRTRRLELPPLATEATRCADQIQMRAATGKLRAFRLAPISDAGAYEGVAPMVGRRHVTPRTLIKLRPRAYSRGSLQRRADHASSPGRMCLWAVENGTLSVSLTIMAGKFTDSQSNSSRK